MQLLIIIYIYIYIYIYIVSREGIWILFAIQACIPDCYSGLEQFYMAHYIRMLQDLRFPVQMVPLLMHVYSLHAYGLLATVVSEHPCQKLSWLWQFNLFSSMTDSCTFCISCVLSTSCLLVSYSCIYISCVASIVS